ncbi:hypothetical protein LRS13_19705 [Svornostia abyssi]|uniref:Uncharacterized protein n=1 Tax=Svornostia abyssi TaxID=2898438 RepID=A0ABY5PEP7_9ACTN|nr:hypothetical protein LRS13_19705 [Parviterribacteraceae bacterium J379]
MEGTLMATYDITIALGQVGTDDDLGVELASALKALGIAVVTHDLVGRTLEIDMTVSAPDLATAATSAIRATRETCERAGVPDVEATSLSASRARTPEHTAA